MTDLERRRRELDAEWEKLDKQWEELPRAFIIIYMVAAAVAALVLAGVVIF